MDFECHLTARPLDNAAGFERALRAVGETHQRTGVIFVGDIALRAVVVSQTEVRADAVRREWPLLDEGFGIAHYALNGPGDHVRHVNHVG